MPYDSIPLNDLDHEVCSISNISSRLSKSIAEEGSESFSDAETIRVNDLVITRDIFGYFLNPLTMREEPISRFTWTTKYNMTVQVITYGARITSIRVPDCEKHTVDVLMGCDTIETLIENQHHHFGSFMGQTVGNLQESNYCHRGKVVYVSENDGPNHLNGGFIGFDQVNWIPCLIGSKLVLSHMTPENHEGYPGRVLVWIEFNIRNSNIIEITIKAIATKPTPFDIGQRMYFNLSGHDGSAEAMREHVLSVNADSYLNDKKVNSIDVGSTRYDLRVANNLGWFLDKNKNGFDTNFIINLEENLETSFAARLYHPGCGRAMEIYSNQPIIYINNCSHFPVMKPKPVKEIIVAYKKSDSKFLQKNNLSTILNVDDCSIIKPKCNPNITWPHCPLTIKSKANRYSSASIQNHHMPSTRDSCDFSDDSDVSSIDWNMIKGKGGVNYYQNTGLLFQIQNFPPKMISVRKFRDEMILNPGEIFEKKIIYKFGFYMKSSKCNIING